ncbi:MAG: putative Ig domain-containing protein [Leptospiraceae bacterium]|nr:putative Ig domain-containing protein [Leptospiraceae bacterium]MCP5499536.1 putative Ig domain-containing protein [Leptospiraceae bacterium]
MRILIYFPFFFLLSCKITSSDGKDSLIRLFFLQNDNKQKVSMSIKGKLNDANGKPISNSVLILNTTGISSSLSKKGRQNSNDTIRCVDYSFKKNYLRCVKIIQPDLFEQKSSNACYEVYYGSSTNKKIQSIAKLNNIRSGQSIVYYYNNEIQAESDRFTIFSCTGDLLSEGIITDNTIGGLTDSNGEYTINLKAGKINTISVKTPIKDMGDIKIDLSSKTTKESLEEIKNDTTKLDITIPSNIQITYEVATITEDTSTPSSVDQNPDTTTTTNDTQVDSSSFINSLMEEIKTEILLGIAYPNTSYNLSQNIAVSISPTLVGAITTCSVSPALPSGLSLNTTNCTISGTPDTITASQNYTITAANSFGNINTILPITIKDGVWIQDAYLKASNNDASNGFGSRVAIDGDYAVVAVNSEDNSSTTINNTDNASFIDDNSVADSGAVYVFKRDATTGDWIQDAYLKTTNAEAVDNFGWQVAISGDYIIAGAPDEDNGSTSINNTDNGSITDTTFVNASGAAYIFKRDSSGNWIQDAYLKATNAGPVDKFGTGVTISGNYAAVGASGESSNFTSINNTDNASFTDDDSAASAGAVYVFKRDSTTGDWILDAYLKASNAEASDSFGQRLAMSGDYLIVAAITEDNSSTSINNVDNSSIADDNAATDSGAAYIFKRDPTTGDWIQDAYLKGSNTAAGDNFASSVAISGNFAIVGARTEDSNFTGINNTDNASFTDNDLSTDSGAAYIFKRDETTGNWIQDAYLKPTNTGVGDKFGVNSISISGNYAVVSAYLEDNVSTTINNTDNASFTDDDSATDAGAVYVFKRNVVTGIWTQDAYLKATNTKAGDQFGQTVYISGKYIIVGSSREDNNLNTIYNTDNASITNDNAATDSGAAYIFKYQ